MFVSISAVLWGDHSLLAEVSLRPVGPHPVGLRGSRDPLLQAQGGCDGAAAVAWHLQAARYHLARQGSRPQALHKSFPSLPPPSREHPPSEASLPAADPALSRAPPSALACFHEFPAVARATEGLHSISGVWHVQPEEWNVRRERVMPYSSSTADFYVNVRTNCF